MEKFFRLNGILLKTNFGGGRVTEAKIVSECKYCHEITWEDALELELDYSGFPDFERRVLEKVREIPLGRVTSYKEVANAVGSKAIRAVGKIMAKNPFAVIVPCHRVIKADSTLGNYSWGTEMKKKILMMEGVEIKNGKVVGGLFKF